MHLKTDSTLQSGKYRIIKVLGQGGFGITYLAENILLGRAVAIKEFFPKDYCERDDTSQVTVGTSNALATVERLKTRFIKEARNIARLDHSGIVRIHDVFEENLTAYYVMEYIEGENLSQIVKKDGPLPEKLAVEYIRKVASALDYIHSHNMTHFDVKPANIVVRAWDNMPILIDFGLSKQYDEHGEATSTMMSGFSHGYSAIELYTSGRINSFSPQTDVYSLGATLFFMLTGQNPPNASEVLDSGLAVPPTVDKRIAEAIRKGMEASRVKRPVSAGDMVAMLPEYRPTPPPVDDKADDDDDTVMVTATAGEKITADRRELTALREKCAQAEAERDESVRAFEDLRKELDEAHNEQSRYQGACDSMLHKLKKSRQARNCAIFFAAAFFILCIVAFIMFLSKRSDYNDAVYKVHVARTELDEIEQEASDFKELMTKVTGGQEVFFNDIKVRNDGEEYEGTIYSGNTTYINPGMEAYNLSDQTKTIGVKFFGPFGLSTGDNSRDGFSYTDEIGPGHRGWKELLGWGSATKGQWKPGSYRYEFWVDGKCIAQKSFTIR